jgi:hypothetical protein
VQFLSFSDRHIGWATSGRFTSPEDLKHPRTDADVHTVAPLSSARAVVDEPARAAPELPPVTSAVAFQDLLDAMPDSTAVLDETGTIVAVNHAWQMFTHDNGGEPSTTGPGVNYLSVCSASAAAGSADAAEVEIALRQVIDGETVESVLDYRALPRS